MALGGKLVRWGFHICCCVIEKWVNSNKWKVRQSLCREELHVRRRVEMSMGLRVAWNVGQGSTLRYVRSTEWYDGTGQILRWQEFVKPEKNIARKWPIIGNPNSQAKYLVPKSLAHRLSTGSQHLMASKSVIWSLSISWGIGLMTLYLTWILS